MTSVATPNLNLDRVLGAFFHLLRSFERNPFNPVVDWLLANAYSEIDGDSDRQLAFYNSSLELDPDDDNVVVARMAMYMDAGRLDDAENDLERLHHLGSSHADPMAEHLRRAKEGDEPSNARKRWASRYDNGDLTFGPF